MAWQDYLPLVLRSEKGAPLDAVDMDLNFTLIGTMLCDLVAGHSHDGVNSKSLPSSVITDIGGPSGWLISTNTLTGGAQSLIVGGKIQSPDWGINAGTQIDLVNKTMMFGGSSAPKFSVNSAGVMTAVDAHLSGAITAATIDIGGADATSFHADIDGNVWSGAATFANAPFGVTNAGALKATNATITGTITGSVVQTAVSGARVILDTTGLRAYNTDPLQTVNIGVDGSGWFGLAANKAVEWSAGGAVKIAGFITDNQTLSFNSGDHTTTVSSGAIAFSAGNTGAPEFSVTQEGLLTATNAHLSGAITAATIDIGGADATSFHVDLDGNVWSGAALLANAAFSVTSAGELVATSAIIEGSITATGGTIGGFTVDPAEGLYAGSVSTRVQMKAGVGIWTGATAFDDAPFKVSCSGVLTATGVNISGAINATSGSFTGTVNASGGTFTGTISGGSFIGGTISTDEGVDIDTPGIIIDSAGLRGYANLGGLGIVEAFNLPLNGDPPSFYGGVISETEIEIYTSGVIRTAEDALTGVGGAAGVVITPGGIFAGSAGQDTANANFRLSNTGNLVAVSATISGAVSAATIEIGGDDATSFHVDIDGGIWSGASIANKATAPFRVSNAGALVASSVIISGMVQGSYLYGSSLMTKGTYLSTSCSDAAAILYVGDTTDFPSPGTAWFMDSANDRDAFTYTGKTSTTLTGCSGVLAHTVSSTNKPLVIPTGEGIYIAALVNEMRFVGDAGGGIEELASIGLILRDEDYAIGQFGSLTSGNTTYGIMAFSYGKTALYGESITGHGIMGASSEGIGVAALSVYSYGVQAESINSHGLHGISSASYGVYAYSLSSHAIYSDGTLYATKSITVNEGDITATHGDIVIGDNGHGIKFPATSAGSSDPNTLDDYEEKPFTPGLSFGGGTTGITYNVHSGFYVKIGNTCFFQGIIILTSKGSATGAAKITGLPFTVYNSSANLAPVNIVTINVSITRPGALVDANATTVTLRDADSNMTDAAFANNSYIYFSGHYRV